ncbi:hypothetical protein Golomagni_02916 [Golovinomyces magnicellulatus]|nr:hypothetical protein Golomagni_02916 [Golovinomyces magnicellulatus]
MTNTTATEKNDQGESSKSIDDSYTAAKQQECEELLKQFQSTGIKMSREDFEKIYFSQRHPRRDSPAADLSSLYDYRKRLGTPTPLSLMGFLICLSPLSCDLMGWRGAGGNGAAGMGSYFFFGGLLMILGGLLEFIMGKTFSFVVFCSFGGFWLTLASTLQPFYNVGAAYAVNPNSTSLEQGFATIGFTASNGFFYVFMAVLCSIYFICSLRTNICNVFIFFCLTLAFSLLAAVNWTYAEAFAGDQSKIPLIHKLQVAAGAFLFITSLMGWYSFFAIMLISIDFPYQFPIGELSGLIKSRTERMRKMASPA